MARALGTGNAHRIAVFRALVLGDLLCATPSLRVLRTAWPQAQITLIGLPWAQELVQRLPSVDRLLPFPGYPGLPEGPVDISAWPRFLAGVQAERFDLALQMHGSGGITNPLVCTFGAAHTGGFYRPGEFCPDPALFTPWPDHAQEVHRCLALTDALGLPRQGEQLDFPLQPEDDQRLRQLWPGCSAPYVVLHAGAQLPSRRWPIERFARVAEALAGTGLQVVLTGTASEAPLAQALRQGCRQPLVDLLGRTDLWTLGALVRGARLLVANDTGVSHVAAALGTPSVIVSMGSDVRRWAPLDTDRHRVLWQDLPCRPCGHRTCPTAHECATAIASDDVIAAALDLLQLHHTPLQPWQTPANPCASSPGMCTATTSTT
ncbi:glycosyltransferase family 9 protein [Ideonella sp. BN130291]|uniref:glycosyltransferase family 9 protein n=1 Tax=Ideonella sp. BN130291 TaxID=3112940 RepID=UPI002E265DD9|nr:glycosyltransferase family 9 protein [Ideonella sp. BN130291]